MQNPRPWGFSRAKRDNVARRSRKGNGPKGKGACDRVNPYLSATFESPLNLAGFFVSRITKSPVTYTRDH